MNLHTKKSVVIFLIVLCSLTALLYTETRNSSEEKELIAPNGRITIDVADSDEERRQGLSGRESLANDQGLLFVFDEVSQNNCFWMKDMRFSIDMVWIDESKRVITVASNVTPETYPDSFCPSGLAKYGLELTSGNTNALGISEGVTLDF